MQRPIRFRAWDTVDKQWWSSLAVSNALDLVVETQGYHIKLQQFTGLKDKNGVEIYEGDIVRCKVKDDKDKRKLAENYTSDVFWDTDSWCVHDSPNCDTMLGRFTDEEKKWPKTTIEVIGNIYESPELLNQINGAN